MCGRFALGVGAAQLRAGVADHFPRLLNRRDNRAPERDPDHATQAGAGGRNGRRGRGRGGGLDRRGGRGRGGGRRNARATADIDEGEAEEGEGSEPNDEDEDEQDPQDSTGNRVSPGIVEPPARRLRGGGAGGIDPSLIPWENQDRFREGNYNVAPRSNSVVIRLRPRTGSEGSSEGPMRIRGGGNGGEEVGLGFEKGSDSEPEAKTKMEPAEESVFDVGDQELVIETMQWGLIPHWSKHPPTGPLNTINARSENLIDHGAGGMWQSLKGPKRCLVVVQGYYEWQKKGATKIAHFTCYPSPGSENKPSSSSSPQTSPPLMLLAGLYDTVRYVDDPEDAPPHKTFTILTTRPSKSLEFLHDRMPCILDEEEELVRWLDCRNGWDEGRAKLLRPYEGKVECYPVQPEVGKVGTNSSSYILPVAKRKDGIANMFAKQVAKGSPTKPAIGKVVREEVKVRETSESPFESGIEVRKAESKDGVKPAESSSFEAIHHPIEDAIAKAGSRSIGSGKQAIKTELKQEGLDQFIGDDSNAPNPPAASPGTIGQRQTRASAKRGVENDEEKGEDEVQVLSGGEDEARAKRPPRKKRKP